MPSDDGFGCKFPKGHQLLLGIWWTEYHRQNLIPCCTWFSSPTLSLRIQILKSDLLLQHKFWWELSALLGYFPSFHHFQIPDLPKNFLHFYFPETTDFNTSICFLRHTIFSSTTYPPSYRIAFLFILSTTSLRKLDSWELAEMAVLRLKFTKSQRDKLAQVLWLLNWVSVVTGIILFSLGLFLKVQINKRRELMAEREIHSVPNMLIAVGLIACIINFLGGKICYDCVDTNKFLRWKLVMLPYIICTFFFTLCVLVGALMCYSMHGELEESLALGLQDAMRYYKDTDTPGRCFLKRTVDQLQIQFQCCGNNGYRDWFQIQWISNRYLDMSKREVQE